MKVVDVKVITPVDGRMYTILPYDSATMVDMNWYRKKVYSGVLTPGGVDSLETIIDSACKAYNEKTPDSLYQVMPLQKYRRQYMPVVTADGDRVVWVNFFCDDFSVDWRKQIVAVKDGGNCFFQLFININRRKAYDLSMNGYAFLPARRGWWKVEDSRKYPALV